MTRAWAYIQSRFTDEWGASLVEYALLLVLIAVVAIAAIQSLGGSVSDTFSDVEAELNGAGGPATTSAP